jgi:hypothetical protein
VAANEITVSGRLCRPARRIDELELPEGQYIGAPPDVGDHVMNDTVRIKRPICCRRQEDVGGRVKQDSLGNTIKVRTRVHDPEDDIDRLWLERRENMERSSKGMKRGKF